MERLLLWLGGKRVNLDEEDRVLWTPMKSGKFSIKSLYKALRVGFFSLLPNEDHLEFLCVAKSKLL